MRRKNEKTFEPDVAKLRTVLQSVSSMLAIYTVKEEPVPVDVALKLYTVIQNALRDGNDISKTFTQMAQLLEDVVAKQRNR